MTLSLLLLLAPFVDIRAELNLPIPMCEPVLLIDPPVTTFTFWEPTAEEWFYVRSSCSTVRPVRWEIKCDNSCLDVFPTQGITPYAMTQKFDDYSLTTRWDSRSIHIRPTDLCAVGFQLVKCQVTWTPCPQADMDRSCYLDRADIAALSASPARNRLEVFAHLQNGRLWP